MSMIRSKLRPYVVAGVDRAARVARRHNWLVEAAPISQPPTQTVVQEPPDPETEPNEYGLTGIDAVLHALRSAELSRMPKVDGPVLSAGCSGTLYFRWIDRYHGPVARHIGVELYLPKPDDLPDNAEWITASAADTSLPDGSVALAFSGQNIEHLFDDDVVRFLLECHRVIEPSGWLVIDSPNREIAAAYAWTQPEHTIEFTPAEAVDLVTLAGFDVVNLRGLWLCRDREAGGLLPFWPSDGRAPRPEDTARRAALAASRPEDSFIWWLEARRADRAPDVAALHARYADIAARAWPERWARHSHAVGERKTVDGREVISVPAGAPGYALYGPYVPLRPGEYQVTYTLRRSGRAARGAAVAELDVADATGAVLAARSVDASRLAPGKWTDLSLSFRVDQLTWGGQFRVHASGAGALDVVVGTRVEHPDAPVPTQPRRA